MTAWADRMLVRQARPAVGLALAIVHALVLNVPQLAVTGSVVGLFSPELQTWLRMFTSISAWALVPISIAVWLILSSAADACALLMGGEARPAGSWRFMDIHLFPPLCSEPYQAFSLQVRHGAWQWRGLVRTLPEHFADALKSHPVVAWATALSRTGLQLSIGVFCYLVAKVHHVAVYRGVVAVLVPLGLWWLLASFVTRAVAG